MIIVNDSMFERIGNRLVELGYPETLLEEGGPDAARQFAWARDDEKVVSIVVRSFCTHIIKDLTDKGLIFNESSYKTYLADTVWDIESIYSYDDFVRSFFTDIRAELQKYRYSEDVIEKVFVHYDVKTVEEARSKADHIISLMKESEENRAGSMVAEVADTLARLGYPAKLVVDSEIDAVHVCSQNKDRDDVLGRVIRVLCRHVVEDLTNKGLIFNELAYESYLFDEVRDTKDICSYDALVSRFFTDIKRTLLKLGYSKDVIDEALDGYDVKTVEEAEDKIESYLKLVKRRNENLRAMKELEAQGSEDYTDNIQEVLNEKHITVLHPREVADEFFNNLSTAEQQDYFNNPTYAAYRNLEDSRFQTAISNCLQRFNHSKMVDMVIDEYIQKNYPEETNKSMLIDRIASQCPAVARTDDVRANAYLAIALQKETAESDESVSDEEVKEAESDIASKILSSEPFKVAERACKTTASAAKKAMANLAERNNSTVAETITTKQQEEPEFNEAVNKKFAEYQAVIEKLQETVNNQQKQLDSQHQHIVNNNMNAYQQRQYNNGYPYNGYQNNGYSNQPYGNQQYGNQPGMFRMPPWLLGIAFNVVAMFIVFLIGSLGKMSIGLGQIGLLISAIGYPMLGKHKDAKRFLVIGYGLFILWLAWTLLL